MKYFSDNGEPIKCTICGTNGKEFKQIIKDTLDGYIVLEYELLCPTCNESVGYWAYGSFDPCYQYKEL